MAIINSPPRESNFIPAWLNFFNQAYRILKSQSESGTTAQRPTTDLWIGRRYYDTTLSMPVWVQQVNPTVVWKDAAGNTV